MRGDQQRSGFARVGEARTVSRCVGGGRGADKNERVGDMEIGTSAEICACVCVYVCARMRARVQAGDHGAAAQRRGGGMLGTWPRACLLPLPLRAAASDPVGWRRRLRGDGVVRVSRGLGSGGGRFGSMCGWRGRRLDCLGGGRFVRVRRSSHDWRGRLGRLGMGSRRSVMLLCGRRGLGSSARDLFDCKPGDRGLAFGGLRFWCRMSFCVQ
jgi:hypothetical protein